MKMFTTLSLVSTAILVLSPLVASAQPDRDRTIKSFSVIREGGGDLQVLVAKASNGSIVAKTIHCQFKTLTPAQQQQTAFNLSGETAVDAGAVLDDQAELAEGVRLLPLLATGTWLTMSVDYSYEDYASGKQQETTANLRYPLVLVNGQANSMLADIETTARAVNKSLCN